MPQNSFSGWHFTIICFFFCSVISFVFGWLANVTLFSLVFLRLSAGCGLFIVLGKSWPGCQQLVPTDPVLITCPVQVVRICLYYRAQRLVPCAWLPGNKAICLSPLLSLLRFCCCCGCCCRPLLLFFCTDIQANTNIWMQRVLERGRRAWKQRIKQIHKP